MYLRELSLDEGNAGAALLSNIGFDLWVPWGKRSVVLPGRADPTEKGWVFT